MKTWTAVALCVGAAVSGCGNSAPPVQLNLKGQFQGAASATLAEPLLLAMGWYPSFGGTAPGAPAAAVLTQANLSFKGNFPVDFTFKLSGPPPAAALFDLSTTGGKGHLAYGVLIAFRDNNSNGAFDAMGSDGKKIDDIAGISVPDPSLPPPAHSFFVVYLDGAPAASDYYSAFPLQQGYNLLELHYDFGIEPIPLDSNVEIPITNTAAANLFACQAAFQTQSWFKRSCGIDPYAGTYQAQGSVFATPTGTQMQLFVNDADGNVANAAITLDGAPVPYDATSLSYASNSSTSMHGSHTLAFTVPGRTSETLAFTLPDPVLVQAPAAGQTLTSGAPVSISWASVAGTAYYDLYFYAADGSQDWLFHTITTATSVTTPPIAYQGAARLTVKALAALAVGSQGSFVTPISQTSLNLTFAH